MEKSLYVERMLGTENLTDELEDLQADWLLNWGVTRLDRALLLAAADDTESAGIQVNALMAVMRKINRITGARRSADPEALAADFAALNRLFNAAFGGDREVTLEECRAAAGQVAALSAQGAVEFLAEWGTQRQPPV
jgi:hypothetical protein